MSLGFFGCSSGEKAREAEEFPVLDSMYRAYRKYEYLREFDSAMCTLVRLDSLTEKLGSREGRILYSLAEVSYFMQQGQRTPMLVSLDRALIALDETDPPILHAYTLSAQSYADYYCGRASEGRTKAHKAMAMYENLGDSVSLSRDYINMALQLLRNAEGAQSKDAINQAVRWAPDGEKIVPQLYRASMLILQGDQVAGAALNDSIRIIFATQINQPDYAHYLLYLNDFNLGNTRLEAPIMDSLEAVSQRIGGVYSNVLMPLMWAETHMRNGDWSKAEEVFRDMLKQEELPLNYRIDVLKGLVRVYLQMGGDVRLYECYEELLHLTDSTNTWNYNELEKQTRQLAFNAQQIERLNSERREARMKWMLAMAILAIATMAMLLWIVLRKLRDRKERILQIERDLLLQQQRQELYERRLSQTQTQEHIKEFTQQIKEIAPEMSKTVRVRLMQHMEQFNEHQRESSWADFEKDFALIHGDYMERLRNAYPDMPQMYQRMCMLIRCDTPVKEMATMLHLSPDTVKTYRKRLRKILKMEDENMFLNDFLRQF